MHNKRKGEGCHYEMDVDDSSDHVCCSWAYNNFGGYYSCKAPQECWMDEKVTTPFEDEKHCPNCSEPNKPFDMVALNSREMSCKKCNFHLTKWMG